MSEDELLHYGVARRSGRYPWGSGENPKQNSKDFIAYEQQLRRSGLSEKEVADAFGMSIKDLRTKKSVAKNEQRAADAAMVSRLKDKGMSTTAISRQTGIPEPTVRTLLEPARQARLTVLESTTTMLKESVAKDKYIDIGPGAEYHMPGVNSGSIRKAVSKLKEEEGYVEAFVRVPQLGVPGQFTTMRVLAPPGTQKSDIHELYKNPSLIRTPFKYTEDGGATYQPIEPPRSISSKRIMVRYKDDGGDQMDGVIELRRGVDDLSLGGKRYAQVRVAVDDSHYLKGMAVYADDLPKGVDIRFNTPKANTGNKLDAMKPLKTDDPERPFGTVVSQRHYVDASGKKQLSPLNIVNEEGDWHKWSNSLSSQMLSKQTPALAKKQLDLAYDRKRAEYDEIMALTNPTIKKKLLESFADDADSAAVHLKAAALPRQRSQVILPIPGLKEGEIFAPNFKNGERVVLIRHPHGGPFEIPELTVNNRNAKAKAVMGGATDAVGINHKVAAKLSGADFDGDTVLVIPNNKGQVKTAPTLKGLKDFDPTTRYPAYEGMKPMSKKGTGKAMGDISNLITDMHIKGATNDELAAAVRHSMVIIDAEKKKLNYRQSALDNGIAALKTKYQKGPKSGASTLISLAKSEERVPRRTPRKAQDGGPIDPATGRKMYTPTGESYVRRKVDRKTGKVTETTVYPTQKSTKMAEINDARKLSSGEIMEGVYASYANRMKSLGNEARKSYLQTGILKYSPPANKTYATEARNLKAKLHVALSNAPLERQAQALANTKAKAIIAANPGYDADDIKKVNRMQLAAARAYTGAGKVRVKIEPREWEAIQAGAIHDNMLQKILANTDVEVVKAYATPRASTAVSAAKATRARTMADSGATQAEIADALGIGINAVVEALK